jgi:Flp pilus assembly protein TadG
MVRRRERGAAAVEFALVLPLLLSTVGGAIDFGRLYYQQIMLSNAARDGARLASMGTTTYGDAAVRTATKNAAKPMSLTDAQVQIASPRCSGTPAQATVTVTPPQAFKWTILGFIPALPTPTLQGKATMTCP